MPSAVFWVMDVVEGEGGVRGGRARWNLWQDVAGLSRVEGVVVVGELWWL